MNLDFYEKELMLLSKTYEKALEIDISNFKQAVAGSSESSIICIGSGGSYTTASFLSSLHESFTGRVSRPATPLEIICNPNLAVASPVFLISAEGKNPDIIEALKRARIYSAHLLHILTNRRESLLLECSNSLSDITSHIYEIDQKDGFLATNSLLFNSVIIARSYGGLNLTEKELPKSIFELGLFNTDISSFIAESEDFISEAASRKGVVIIYSPQFGPVASDLESKLSESALLFCQLSDLRSFAHGRHLWLADRPSEISIIALVEPTLKVLWEEMKSHFPEEVPVLTLSFKGSGPEDLLAGLVAQMQILGKIALKKGKNIGKPKVPEFGRKIHYAKLDSIPAEKNQVCRVENSKSSIFGAHWPFVSKSNIIERSYNNFLNNLKKQSFKAIVFDYDGTLCSSSRSNYPPTAEILKYLNELLDNGIAIGIATGRGDSIYEELRLCISEEKWNNIHLGLYNGGYILDLNSEFKKSEEVSEFLNHVLRLVGKLNEIGVPIERIRLNQPYQISIRFKEGVKTEENWFIIADILRQAGLNLLQVVKSKHSIDILNFNVSKSHLIAYILEKYKIDPYEIITIGDQGAWPGNDSALLDHKFSLSVDAPSRKLDRGWKIAPDHKKDVDATIWYLERIKVLCKGKFIWSPDM